MDSTRALVTSHLSRQAAHQAGPETSMSGGDWLASRVREKLESPKNAPRGGKESLSVRYFPYPPE